LHWRHLRLGGQRILGRRGRPARAARRQQRLADDRLRGPPAVRHLDSERAAMNVPHYSRRALLRNAGFSAAGLALARVPGALADPLSDLGLGLDSTVDGSLIP